MAKKKETDIVSGIGHKGTLMEISRLVEGHIVAFNEGDKNVPVPHVEGPPGVGKTDMFRALAAKHGMEFRDIPLIIWDTVDFRGIPYVRDSLTHWALPSELPREGRGLLFLDEFKQCYPSIQNCASRLILSRQLGEFKLADGWMVALASNRDTDKAATHKVASHMNNRLAHYEVTVDLKEWQKWAVQNGVHDRIIAFVTMRPNLLHEFDPDRPAFPSPRTWALFSKLLRNADDADVSAYCTATVGEGACSEFWPFWKDTAKLPSFQDILKAPMKTPVPTEPSQLYAVAVMIGQSVDAKNFDTAWKYVARMEDEYSLLSLYIVMSRSDYQKLMASSEEVGKWVSEHSYMFRK